ncbi:methyltransferase regulatory domain-containing protein [Urbifossiella limnaea]|uniref:Trans-aconitate 2-methyltransferase n=1 Tax=Urbifossiella limnaea TaxID=2528023 RepID=A0A517XMY8_9BACT|nr:class I SAM-dependent methyltransferase [Urbifossiella limnaea]QDU18871.1 Trans-aconitate 2-methyltransferase [Urbifossiella limnaea]
MESNTYDEVPYDSHPYAQTHPSRLAVVARLFGLNPPPVQTARVLELGAAAGGNLVPVAERFPQSHCVGVDLSARQVADGVAFVTRLGLKNIELRHASITDVDESYGTFDYVVCHGVFSWVPTTVRDAILDVCARRLAPNGVAYVSYNTYPGWHMRGMIRDMMRYHAMRFPDAKQRVGQARALLDFLAASNRQEGAYTALLKAELESVRKQADHYLFHEHLEENNDPLYFHQFVAMAEAHGLRYMGEARVGTMVTGNFGPDVQKTLRTLAADQVQTEQYMDFLRNRTFRETLLVPAAATPNWTIDPAAVRTMHVASAGKPATKNPPDINTEAPAQYQTRSGMTLSTNRPLLKAAMQVLGERWPGTTPFDELLTESRLLLGRPADTLDDDGKTLALGLVNTYISSDLLELHAAPIAVSRVPGEKPEVVKSARLQAGAGAAMVTNRRHELVKLTDLDKRLVPLLDGTRTRPELVEALTADAVAGQLQVARNGKPVTGDAAVREALTAVLDPALTVLTGHALLVS